MLIKDSYQDALRLSEETNIFLSEYQIAPSPANYAVIYLYVSKRNAEIKALIDQCLKKNESLEPAFMDELFLTFVSNTKNIEKLVITPFEQTLSSTIKKIENQVANEDQIQESLEKANEILTSNEDHRTLQRIVKFLFASIENSKNIHKNLSEQLNETCKEVVQLKSKTEKARHEAILDALTGLLNRWGCVEKLKDINLDDVHTSLAIDIDHFKSINDNFGHLVGDKVLQRVAKTIKNNLASDDVAVRYGGEEFVVVMVNKDKKQAIQVAEKIRSKINGLRLVQRESKTPLPPISVSIGIAQLDNDDRWSSVFQRADNALYRAKNSGRNCCVCA